MRANVTSAFQQHCASDPKIYSIFYGTIKSMALGGGIDIAYAVCCRMESDCVRVFICDILSFSTIFRELHHLLLTIEIISLSEILLTACYEGGLGFKLGS